MHHHIRQLLQAEDGLTFSPGEMQEILLSLYAASCFSASPEWDKLVGADRVLTMDALEQALEGNKQFNPLENAALRFLHDNFEDLQFFRGQHASGITTSMLAQAMDMANKTAQATMTIRVTSDGGRTITLPRYLDGQSIHRVVQQTSRTKRFLGIGHDWEVVRE